MKCVLLFGYYAGMRSQLVSATTNNATILQIIFKNLAVLDY